MICKIYKRLFLLPVMWTPQAGPREDVRRTLCLDTSNWEKESQVHVCKIHHCLTCNIESHIPVVTLAMASAMDSTIPPTIPTSLAASFSVTMISSTASFMSWAASAMASWVWHACGVWHHTTSDTWSWWSASLRKLRSCSYKWRIIEKEQWRSTSVTTDHKALDKAAADTFGFPPPSLAA